MVPTARSHLMKLPTISFTHMKAKVHGLLATMTAKVMAKKCKKFSKKIKKIEKNRKKTKTKDK